MLNKKKVMLMDTKKIKPTRKLIIKNPKLQAIRDNFRTIIQLAVRDEWQRLMDLDSLYLEKRRLSKKELTSHHKRTCQLHAMKESLITTFSHSICVCDYGSGLSGSITGDRVRYTFITEFDRCYIKPFGVRYLVEEKWYSLKFYEENREILERLLRGMKKRLEQCPDRISTALEHHQRRLDLSLIHI